MSVVAHGEAWDVRASADAAWPAADDVSTDVAGDLRRCAQLLAIHLAAAVRRFGRAGLGVIDLPSLAPAGELVAAQIRATAVLYWASEVDAAGIPGFVDALAQGLVNGHVLLPLTEGAERLMSYWHERHERFDVAERRALYERLFGAPTDANHPFRASLTELCALLTEIAETRAADHGRIAQLVVRANVVARELAQHLSDGGAGFAGFAARDIINHIRAALATLHDADIATALGGMSPWQIIRLHAPAIMERSIEPEPHLERASAGLTILTWLADHASALEAGTARITADGALVQAAVRWHVTRA